MFDQTGHSCRILESAERPYGLLAHDLVGRSGEGANDGKMSRVSDRLQKPETGGNEIPIARPLRHRGGDYAGGEMMEFAKSLRRDPSHLVTATAVRKHLAQWWTDRRPDGREDRCEEPSIPRLEPAQPGDQLRGMGRLLGPGQRAHRRHPDELRRIIESGTDNLSVPFHADEAKRMNGLGAKPRIAMSCLFDEKRQIGPHNLGAAYPLVPAKPPCESSDDFQQVALFSPANRGVQLRDGSLTGDDVKEKIVPAPLDSGPPARDEGVARPENADQGGQEERKDQE